MRPQPRANQSRPEPTSIVTHKLGTRWECAYHAHTMSRHRNAAPNKGRKRPFNLTLNEELMEEIKLLTDNVSALVESLLDEHLRSERRRQLEKANAVAESVGAWNRFSEEHGSIADEYSTL
jgi:antitoxin CcdA